jgi:hypothetical protein
MNDMDDRYANREIDQLFDQQALEHALLQRSIEEVKVIATASYEQAKKTNGRVSTLETWRSYLTGALAVITFVTGAVLIPIFVKILSGGTV